MKIYLNFILWNEKKARKVECQDAQNRMKEKPNKIPMRFFNIEYQERKRHALYEVGSTISSEYEINNTHIFIY